MTRNGFSTLALIWAYCMQKPAARAASTRSSKKLPSVSGKTRLLHGRGCFYRVDQAGALFHADMDFHSKVPLAAFLGLVHLWISFHSFVYCGTGGSDQGGIHNRAGYLINFCIETSKNLPHLTVKKLLT